MTSQLFHTTINFIFQLRTLYIVFCTSCFVFITHNSFSSTYTDQAKTDFAKVNEAYINHPFYSVNLTYALYADYSTSTANSSYKGFYHKQNNNVHSHLVGVETIQNSNLTLAIDTAEKAILLADAVKQEKSEPISVDVAKGLESCSRIDYKELPGKEKVYRLFFADENAEYSSIQINLDKDFLIKKMVLYYNHELAMNPEDDSMARKKPRIEITYFDFKSASHFPKEEFSTTKYVDKANGKWALSKAYKNYEFINQKKD